MFAYADDCNCVVLHRGQIRKCIETLDKYFKFTGLEVNKDKCEIMPLPDWRVEQQSLEGIQVVNKIKITGTTISPSQANDCIDNMEDTLNKVEGLIESLSGRALSLGGKSLIINSKNYGLLLHHFRHGKMTPATTKKLNRLIFRFLWNGPDKTKREITRGKKSEMGALMSLTPNL